jgi:hypothetical protein
MLKLILYIRSIYMAINKMYRNLKGDNEDLVWLY